MARKDDLELLNELATRPARVVSYTDLTPDGPLTSVGPGPWIPNRANQGSVHLAQVAGTGAMDVRLEASNTQSHPDEIGSSSKLLGSGSGEIISNWSGAAFIRIRVVDVGSGGSVTATQVHRGA